MRPMPKRQFLKLSLAATATAALAACGGGDEEPGTPDIVGVALTDPQFSILVEAVVAAGLVETLRGPGPFTVFAPNDKPYEALPNGTVAALLQPENIAKLQAVLTYHVVSGQVLAADLIKAIEAGGGTARLTSVEGSVLTASLVNGTVVLTDENGGSASVVAADIKGSNGVIHVTNAVSLPK